MCRPQLHRQNNCDLYQPSYTQDVIQAQHFTLAAIFLCTTILNWQFMYFLFVLDFYHQVDIIIWLVCITL